jgi:UDP-N-acetylglucosamine--N-acetylmuramyl-(pentapeptide) pyrophosphoryl-undecaprenol N-acetylglucosamine transferase
LRIPVVLLEQNTVPGRATRWLSRGAALTCVSYAETLGFLRRSSATAVTGNPVRRVIADLAAAARTTDPTAGSTVLVLGGSQGAAALNTAVPEAFRQLRAAIPALRIVHQTGISDSEGTRRAYAELGVEAHVEAFFSNLSDWYAQATVAISRAGATTLAELACAGIPAILVPYPHAAANHQWHNARFHERTGGAILLEQNAASDTLASRLASELSILLQDGSRLERMSQAMRSVSKPDAASAVVDRMLALIDVDEARQKTTRHERRGARYTSRGHK